MSKKRLIYADNAATTQMSQRAVEAMMKYFTIDFGNASQPYSFARNPKRALGEAREIIASCIGARPSEIFFTSGGTESDNWALINAWRLGKQIISSQIEHHAILNTCAYIEQNGGSVKLLPVDSFGVVDSAEVSKILNGRSFLSIMTVNNELGTKEPLKEYANIAKGHGALFHTDAVQAIGHIPIDVNDIGVDMLSASGHKFNGPKGTGFLYVRQGTPIQPLIQGGAQENGMRAGTENIPAIVAMAIALKENIDELEASTLHLQRMESILIDRLQKGNIQLKRNGINQAPGLISLSFLGMSGEAILHQLDLQGIIISTGSACDSKSTQISHVLKAIHLPIEEATGTIRISLGKKNTEEDAIKIADSLIKISSHIS